ncbi:MAG: hypothetical protein ACOH2A_13825 [Sphingobacteriaceae bacterium]
MKTIRIDISIPIRPALSVLEESKIPGGLPIRVGAKSRIPTFQNLVIDNCKIAIGPDRTLKIAHPNFERFESMLLSIRCENTEFTDVIANTQPTIELVFDHLCFQLQETLFPLTLTLTDVTPKLILGDERETLCVLEPDSILLPKYFSSQLDFRYNTELNNVPSLASVNKMKNRQDQVSLWWYLRALHSPFLIDQINYLFIILDNISKPYKKGPYKTDCHHEITNCPKCDKSIEKQLAGDSIKDFLMKNDFNLEDAKKLWNFRQIVHGKDLFNYVKLQEISSLVNRLKVLIFNTIKSKLDISDTDLPRISSFGGPVVSQNVQLKGTRKLDTFDLKMEHYFNLGSRKN